MPYVVARTARRNPDISGAKLYLTIIGMWTLDRKCALEFKNELAAEAACGRDLECWVEGEDD